MLELFLSWNNITLKVILIISFLCFVIVIVVVWTFLMELNDYQNLIVIDLGVNGP